MALTKNYDETIIARARASKSFKNLLLESAINELMSGDFKVAKVIFRKYINAFVSFDELAKETKMHNKSIQRMFSSAGNPTSTSLISILQAIQKIEGFRIQSKLMRE